MAAGKLQEWIPTRPITFRKQNAINLSLLAVAVVAGVWLVLAPHHWLLFPLIILLSLAFGVLLIIPIGGADMPTVIALLNAYAGLSAVAMGFVLNNKLLIAAGALDGSSGRILSIIMCRAMNRSFANVLFGAFGQVQVAAGAAEQRTVKSATAEDAAQIMGANDVVNPAARHDKSSPIYGMPIIDADRAKTVFVINRSMNPGFAGIENELFYADNTLMLFGDAHQHRAGTERLKLLTPPRRRASIVCSPG
jgi:NAD/NADP transhydrogenase beta subunit